MKKRILLLSSDFFNYYILIKKELENQGWDVVYLNDRPSRNALVKIIIRKFRFLTTWYLNFYFFQKIKILGKFDHVLIIKGEGITPRLIQKLKNDHCRGEVYLYLWDGIKNSPGALANSKCVDKTFTFDPIDAEKHKFELLPLFYVEGINKKTKNQDAKTWSISFVGSIHGDRLRVISRFRNNLRQPEKMFVFAYFASPILYFFRRFFDPNITGFKKTELSLRPLTKTEVEDIFTNSHAVLDIHSNGQTGLTMRTLETLSLGKKLITTNKTIKMYPFYNQNWIYIIDRNNPVIDESFLYQDVEPDITELIRPYEIKNWVTLMTKKETVNNSIPLRYEYKAP